MTRRRRRNPKQEYFYHVRVEDWSAQVRFNDYAYLNIFDQEPFTENCYITLSGYIESTMSKKIEKGHRTLVILHANAAWDSWNKDDPDLSIGNMERVKDSAGSGEKTMYFRVSIPPKSHSMIRSYLSRRTSGRVDLVGTDLFRNKGELFYFGFDSAA